MYISILDYNRRIKIPNEICENFSLSAGDELVFRVQEGLLVLEKISQVRRANNSYSEWDSPEDEEAYRDL